jgi:hypothetical protein
MNRGVIGIGALRRYMATTMTMVVVALLAVGLRFGANGQGCTLPPSLSTAGDGFKPLFGTNSWVFNSFHHYSPLYVGAYQMSTGASYSATITSRVFNGTTYSYQTAAEYSGQTTTNNGTLIRFTSTLSGPSSTILIGITTFDTSIRNFTDFLPLAIIPGSGGGGFLFDLQRVGSTDMYFTMGSDMRLYCVDFSGTAATRCSSLDISLASALGTITSSTNIQSPITFRLQGSRIYGWVGRVGHSFTTGTAGSFNAAIWCYNIDPTTGVIGSACGSRSQPYTTLASSYGTSCFSIITIRNTTGAPTHYCAWGIKEPSFTAEVRDCVDYNTGAITSWVAPSVWNVCNPPANGWQDSSYAGAFSATEFGNRVLFSCFSGRATINCWDWTTNSWCAGWKGDAGIGAAVDTPSSNVLQMFYEVTQDPSGCLWALGHHHTYEAQSTTRRSKDKVATLTNSN